MNNIKYITLLFLIHICVNAQNKQTKFVIDDDGITVEKADSIKTYDENYNSNNLIYNIGKKFTYSYYYQNFDSAKFLIKKGKEIMQPEGYSISDWEFVDKAKEDSETIRSLILKPNSGNPFEKHLKDYNQTAVSYEYLMNNGKSFTMEVTGAIENENNVWIHPPRSIFFKILELNPFPYIKTPYKIGTTWKWNLKIGEHWSDKRWLEWKGGIENIYNYEITDYKIIPTKLGELQCYVINSNATSRIGKTKLISYFNAKYGFVKLDYTNIDGTKTIIELEKVE
jgi:hypothetical protein